MTGTSNTATTAETTFLALRPSLLGLAYRMLGTLSDAEDVVQDAWERWSERAGDPKEGSAVDDPGAFLRTVTTRLCIDRYRLEQRRRERYPGPWLPEPVATDEDPLRSIDLRRRASIALLLALETLTPLERATFVLAEAFDYRPREIAPVLGRTQANCRQLLHRARRRLAQSEAPQDAGIEAEARTTQLLDALLTAFGNDDPDTVERLLGADVRFVGDGGGEVPAVSRPLQGRRSVLRLLVGLGRQQRELVPLVIPVNHAAALVLMSPTGPDTVISVVDDGDRITGIYAQRNPHKLARLAPIVLRHLAASSPF